MTRRSRWVGAGLGQSTFATRFSAAQLFEPTLQHIGFAMPRRLYCLPVRVFGIAGTRYCGSTVLGLCLGVADGVFSAGELEEIRQSPDTAQCRLDGPRCTFWTHDFVALCGDDFAHAYDLVRVRAQEVLGADVVLHGDKSPRRYVEHAEANQFDGLIVLFKRPEGFAYSAGTHDKATVADALDQYADTYRSILGGSLPIRAIVFYDDFASDPKGVLATLSGELSIPFDPAMAEYWNHPERFHPISGNHGAFAHLKSLENFKRISQSDYWQQTYGDEHIDWIEQHHQSIALDEKWRTGLDRREQRTVAKHEAAQAVFSELMARTIT